MSIFPRGTLGGSKNGHFNIKMYKNGKIDSHYGRMVPKISIILKKDSNKKFLSIKFHMKKSVGAYVYLSPEGS